MSEPAFDAAHIIATLNRHNVEYVIVGGYAANIYGAVRPTQDIDVTPKTIVQQTLVFDLPAERGVEM